MTSATLLHQTLAVVTCLRLFEPSNSSSDGYIASSTAPGSELLLHSFPRAKSKVWQHFGFHEDNGEIVDTKKVICRLCKWFLSYSGYTTNSQSKKGVIFVVYILIIVIIIVITIDKIPIINTQP